MRVALVLVGLLATGCTPASPPPTPAGIPAALAHPDRSAEDRATDADRHPDAVLAFLEIEPGQTVADLMGGRGYYTELLARAVGPSGKVYAQNNAFVLNRFARRPLSQRLARPGLQHVVRVDAELDAMGLPKGELDAAFMGLFYHDTVWMKADRAAMNRGIFEALKPGGVFVVTDHHALEGHRVEDVKSLHRIERSIVQSELEAAGFVLDGVSDVLRRPEDDRTRNVFEDGLRGKTDRFVLRFRRLE